MLAAAKLNYAQSTITNQVQRVSRYSDTPFLYTVSQISAIAGFVRQIPSIGAVLESTSLPPNVGRLQVKLKDAAIPVGLLQSRNDDYPSSSKKLLMQFVKEELKSYTTNKPIK